MRSRKPPAHLSQRDRVRLKALEDADEALYQLWRQSGLGSSEMLAINSLQKDFIQPAIRKYRGYDGEGKEG